MNSSQEEGISATNGMGLGQKKVKSGQRQEDGAERRCYIIEQETRRHAAAGKGCSATTTQPVETKAPT